MRDSRFDMTRYFWWCFAFLLVPEMSLAVIESILQSTDLSEVLRPFQDISYLLTVFLSVFLANIVIESVKSVIGRSIRNLIKL